MHKVMMPIGAAMLLATGRSARIINAQTGLPTIVRQAPQIPLTLESITANMQRQAAAQAKRDRRAARRIKSS